MKRKRGSYEHVIYIDPKQVVKEFQIGVSIEESRDITTVRVPPLRNDLEQAVNQTGTHWSMDEIAGVTCFKIFEEILIFPLIVIQ